MPLRKKQTRKVRRCRWHEPSRGSYRNASVICQTAPQALDGADDKPALVRSLKIDTGITALLTFWLILIFCLGLAHFLLCSDAATEACEANVLG
jgi:hypothetical protein